MNRHLAAVIFAFVATSSWAGDPQFQPDPASVQRYEAGYRYHQHGWIVLHIEGKPYERGVQHGRLLAPEIARCIKTTASSDSPSNPGEGWRRLRTVTSSLFLRGYHEEFLEEMKGIADGAAAAGAKFEGRSIDLLDIATLNGWAELMTLDGALQAWPTGLEGKVFPGAPRTMPESQYEKCSAFAATGPATADGKVVFGHITMFGLHDSYHFNVWLDVKPERGFRVAMQSYPGGIQSGMDYYQNERGILLTETTIGQTRFEPKGRPLASRTRRAMQYGDTIDSAVAMLREENNGLYTNEWLLADVNTNEIAMFELGTHHDKLFRSSKGEWFGGTPGFYWGCNNTKDTRVKLETIPGTLDRPFNLAWCPRDRDKKWVELYRQYRGRIDENFARTAFTTPCIAKSSSVDAKFTTTDRAKRLESWCLFGPPLGKVWEPRPDERARHPNILPLVPNPWTVIRPDPEQAKVARASVDLDEMNEDVIRQEQDQRRDLNPATTPPAWHGTLLPKSPADLWLTTAFADYERIVAWENALKAKELSAVAKDRLAVQLGSARKNYLAAARALGDVPITKIEPNGSDEGYRIAAGKGLLALHNLRQQMGTAAFCKIMDDFGRAHAGQEVTTAQFVELTKVPRSFSAGWLSSKGLPSCRLDNVSREGNRVTGKVVRPSDCSPFVVDVTLETRSGEKTVAVNLDKAETAFEIEFTKPVRVVLDKYGTTLSHNVYGLRSYGNELEQTAIVYATGDDEPANRCAAEELQRLIRTRGSNVTLPLIADTDATDEMLSKHHIIMVGRPKVFRIKNMKPIATTVSFGPQSFTVRGESFGHRLSAVVFAADNPWNPRYSAVVVAGNGGEATYRAVNSMLSASSGADVLVLPHGKASRELVAAPQGHVIDF